MWVVAFFGAATAYIESALGQIYKEVDEGQFRGGPAYYIEKAMGQKWYAWIFAVATILATGILLPGVQSNSIGNAAELAFGGETTIALSISWSEKAAHARAASAITGHDRSPTVRSQPSTPVAPASSLRSRSS